MKYAVACFPIVATPRPRLLLLLAIVWTINSWTSSLTAQPIQDPVSGHWYEFVSTRPDVRWSEAKQAAEQRTHLGLPGYLATITSADEDSLLHENWGSIFRVWIGGSDAETEGDWRWVTGPEALLDGGRGLMFWRGNGRNGTSFGYSNWQESEPNGSDGGANDEDYLGWNHSSILGVGWNDFLHQPFPQRDNDAMSGYFVEYSIIVPEPNGLLLVVCGLVIMRFTHRLKRSI